jgi:menaquinone-specific isochorismate synthase
MSKAFTMNSIEFTKLLSKAYDQSESSEKPTILQFTTPINKSIDSIYKNIPTQKNIFYMKFPDTSDTYFGIGKIVSHQINSKKELSMIKNKEYSTISNTKEPLQFFGGVSFNLDIKRSYPWNNIPSGEFFIPKILLKEKKLKTTITYIRYIDGSVLKSSIIRDYKNSIAAVQEASSTTSQKIPDIVINKHSVNRKNYLKVVEDVISTIKKTELEKVIISRLIKYNMNHNLSVASFIKHLNKEHANCFNFFICFDKKTTFIGSTPERLISLYNKSYAIDAIAGSASDKENLQSTKEMDEHNYVVDHVKNTMDSISANIEIPSKPKTLMLKYINHLKTPISGILKKKIHILDIIATLYPTPALLGKKSSDALNIINKYEQNDRGWYGGAFGIYDTNGDGEFYVPIRSGLIKDKTLCLFSGSGIISKSIAEMEEKETLLKLEHLLSYFKK